MNDGGLSRLQKRMRAIPVEVREAVKRPLERSGNDIAGDARRLAERSRDTGDLIDSIVVTKGGQATPPYSQPGGSTVVAENAAMVTVGNADVRYAHLVEYGTTKSPAQPFFWPAYRLNRDKIRRRLQSSISRAVRNHWGK